MVQKASLTHDSYVQTVSYEKKKNYNQKNKTKNLMYIL